MLPGCLVIRETPDNNRQVLLHTYHAGTDIPNWVESAPGLDAVNFAEVVICEEDKKNYLCSNVLHSFMNRNAVYSGYHWPPVVAAMVMAVRQRCLHPLFPGYEREMARWARIDSPYILNIGAGADRNLWVLRTTDGAQLLEMDPTEKAEEAVMAWLRGDKDGKKKTRRRKT